MRDITKYIAIAAIMLCASSCVNRENYTEVKNDNCEIVFSVETEENAPQTKSEMDQLVYDEEGNVFATLVSLEEETPVVVVNEPETKGTLVDNINQYAGVLGNTFTVSAYKGATSVFSNLTATQSSQNAGLWNLPSRRFWPVGDTYEFFAYSQHSPSGIVFNKNGSPSTATFAYNTPTTAAAQYDFLLGYYKGQGSNGAAPLRFTHPLTSVKFQFVSFPASIKIKSITLTGIKSSGNCTASFVYASGYTPTYTWDTSTSPATTYTQTFSSLDPSAVNAVPFVLVPQTFAAGSSSSIMIVVDYGGQEKTISVKIASATAAKSWVAGTTYIYKLSYSATTGLDVDDVVTSNIKNQLTLTNTGTAPEFVRAAIVGNWVDADGKIVAAWDKTQGTFNGLCASGSNWVAGPDGFYYYTKPILGGRATANKLFTSYTAPNPVPVAGAHLELSILGQAVIWDSSKTAVTSAWGSTIAALLTAVPEQ